MKHFKILLCHLFGHRSICLYSRLIIREDHYSSCNSMITCWKCERCGLAFTEQWDR